MCSENIGGFGGWGCGGYFLIKGSENNIGSVCCLLVCFSFLSFFSIRIIFILDKAKFKI